MEPWMRADSSLVESDPTELLMKVTMRRERVGSPFANRRARMPVPRETNRRSAAMAARV